MGQCWVLPESRPSAGQLAEALSNLAAQGDPFDSKWNALAPRPVSLCFGLDLVSV